MMTLKAAQKMSESRHVSFYLMNGSDRRQGLSVDGQFFLKRAEKIVKIVH